MRIDIETRVHCHLVIAPGDVFPPRPPSSKDDDDEYLTRAFKAPFPPAVAPDEIDEAIAYAKEIGGVLHGSPIIHDSEGWR